MTKMYSFFAQISTKDHPIIIGYQILKKGSNISFLFLFSMGSGCGGSFEVGRNTLKVVFRIVIKLHLKYFFERFQAQNLCFFLCPISINSMDFKFIECMRCSLKNESSSKWMMGEIA